MSKVLSFRLDADNPREARAMEVIESWVSQGYSLRQILTEALIEYGGKESSGIKWEKVYDQLAELVRGLDNGVNKQDSVGRRLSISSEFVAAMKKGAKEGLVLD